VAARLEIVSVLFFDDMPSERAVFFAQNPRLFLSVINTIYKFGHSVVPMFKLLGFSTVQGFLRIL
jgi:hypothetical protein